MTSAMSENRTIVHLGVSSTKVQTYIYLSISISPLGIFTTVRFSSTYPGQRASNSSVSSPTPGEHHDAPYGAWEVEMEKTEPICINGSTIRSHRTYFSATVAAYL